MKNEQRAAAADQQDPSRRRRLKNNGVEQWLAARVSGQVKFQIMYRLLTHRSTVSPFGCLP
jgi:hypothetical protein